MTSWEEIGRELDVQAATQADNALRQREEEQRARARQTQAQRAVEQFLEVMKRAKQPGMVNLDRQPYGGDSRSQQLMSGQSGWYNPNSRVYVARSGRWCVLEHGDHIHPTTASSDGDQVSAKDLKSLMLTLGVILRANGLSLPSD